MLWKVYADGSEYDIVYAASAAEAIECAKGKRGDAVYLELFDFLSRVAQITGADLNKNHSIDLLFANTVEELGEYAAARTVEKGVKKKKLKEDSTVEAVDLIICSLSLFFANGGTMKDLCKIGQEKLNKWEERVK